MTVQRTGDVWRWRSPRKGPYYFTVNMIACDDVPVILFFHGLFILDIIIMLE